MNPLDPTSEIAAGAAIGRYIVLGRLGSGGMGIVYAAYDPKLDRKVALKLVHATGGSQTGATQARARLIREAQAMAKLSHPNVVTVHDAWEIGEDVALVMEFVDGSTLGGWLRAAPRSTVEVVDVFVKAGRGLAAAHAAGIIHRDFKPDNVLIGHDGRVRVSDFGLARPVAAETAPQPAAPSEAFDITAVNTPNAASLTQTGAVMGTPAYMAPEQYLGRTADARTDQFAFCVALFEGIAGDRPFKSARPEDLAFEVIKGNIAPANKALCGCPRVHRAVLRGLKINPDARFPSMDALLAELTRRPKITAPRLGAALVVLGVLGGGAIAYDRHREKRAAVCKGAERKLVGIWDSDKRDSVRKALALESAPKTIVKKALDLVAPLSAEEPAERTLRAIDRYASAWVAMHTDACEATRVRGDQSDETLDLRMQCLDWRLDELGVLVKVLGTRGGHETNRAVDAVQSLVDVRRCADVAALRSEVRPPKAPDVRAKVDALRKEVREAKALFDTGRYEAGLQVAAPAAAKARAIPYKPIQAEAFTVLAQLHAKEGAVGEAERLLHEALWAAEASRHDFAAAESSVALTMLVGYRLARTDEGLRLGRHAAAALERLVTPAHEQNALLENAIGCIQEARGDYEVALQHYQRATELAEKHLGAEHVRTSHFTHNAGMTLRKLGRFDESRRILERALSLHEKVAGRDHPDRADYLLNIGAVFLETERYDDALRYAREALELLERLLGPDHPGTGLANMGVGEVLRRKGDHKTARAHLEKSVGLLEKTGGRNHPFVAWALTSLGENDVGLGEPARALPVLKRAITIREKTRDTADLAASHFALAKALSALKGNGARVRKLLEAARTEFAKAGAQHAKALAEVDAWLSRTAER